MAKSIEHVVARITNDRGLPVVFVLEPWGEVYEMPADATFNIVSATPPNDAPEIRVEGRRFTVYGWPGSQLEVVPEKGRLRIVADEAAEARFLQRKPRRPRTPAKARA